MLSRTSVATRVESSKGKCFSHCKSRVVETEVLRGTGSEVGGCTIRRRRAHVMLRMRKKDESIGRSGVCNWLQMRMEAVQ